MSRTLLQSPGNMLLRFAQQEKSDQLLHDLDGELAGDVICILMLITGHMQDARRRDASFPTLFRPENRPENQG
ncbi:hypothetical protein BaRGS_00016383 [Batillaria attramentaria]|uniref:Uncharacterized protein n=1 Tax=Batillaria attramentaria TaxID=370345 RepID=A0ABD0KYW7_9CAEN